MTLTAFTDDQGYFYALPDIMFPVFLAAKAIF